ncbi:MAG: nuclease A inhibitor family protein [Pyrinomonadaceae bacterium MAG19_C2-C3]|nr:nuclease A inhibitor family protein [Pyrinomonadaceae bacterium MAG19_C2-C3]
MTTNETSQTIGGTGEDAELLHALARAADGLTMRSESDYPFTIVNFNDINENALPAHLRVLTSHTDTTTPIETTTVEHFFRVAAKHADWHDATEHARTLRFQALVELLTRSLRHTRVYRIGERDIAVFIIGQSASGAQLGLHTRVIET